VRPLRQPAPGTRTRPQTATPQYDPSSPSRISLRLPASSSFVLAAARLRALQLDPGHAARKPGQLRGRSRRTARPHPGGQHVVTGLGSYALLTMVALMGAACSSLARLSLPMGQSGNRSARYDPLHRLAGDLRDEFVIAVVVQDGDTFSFGRCRDQQVGRPTARMRPPRHRAAWTSSARRQSSSRVAATHTRRRGRLVLARTPRCCGLPPGCPATSCLSDPRLLGKPQCNCAGRLRQNAPASASCAWLARGAG
jgi:hypothetical protein